MVRFGRKSSYRLGRRLKSGAKARLDYITYLQSGADGKDGGNVLPPGQLSRASFDLGGLMRLQLTAKKALQQRFDLGGSMKVNLGIPLRISANFGLGGEMELPTVNVIQRLAATFAGEGEMRVGLFPPNRLAARYELGGNMQVNLKRSIALLESFDLGGNMSVNVSRPPTRIQAKFDLGGALKVNVPLATKIAAKFDLGDLMVARVAKPAISLRALMAAEGSFKVNVNNTPVADIDYLIVAGGGGGGVSDNFRGGAGGGGAGGVRTGKIVLAPNTYPVVVGNGGAAETAGGNSSINGIVSTGGGRGSSSGMGGMVAAGAGGSGGGGCGGTDNSVKNGLPGAAGSSGQGNSGGAGGNLTGTGFPPAGGGGGGGGAGAVGATAPNTVNFGAAPGAAGGAGVASSISGTSTVYGSGGGGGGNGSPGGNGGSGAGTGGNSDVPNATSAIANRGGGGGGGGSTETTGAGGAGGSGIVIIRYPGAPRGTGGTITTVGSDTVHTFTANGSLVIAEPPPSFVNSEALAVYNAMTVKPNNTRAALIDGIVGDLKTAGLWAKLDTFYLLWSHDAQAARVNWINPAKFGLTVQGVPVFTANNGYSGNGAGCLLSGFVPSVEAATSKFTRNDSAVFVHSRDVTDRPQLDIGIENFTGILGWNATNGNRGSVHSIGVTIETANAMTAGTVAISRATGGNTQAFQRNDTRNSSTATSQAASALQLAVCGQVAAGPTYVYSNRILKAAGWGANLTQAEVSALNTILYARIP